MHIEAERFLALTAMLAGFVPTRCGSAVRAAKAEPTAEGAGAGAAGAGADDDGAAKGAGAGADGA